MKGTRRTRLSVPLIALGLVCILLAGGIFDIATAQSKHDGEMRWALYVTLSPVWFDPGMTASRCVERAVCTSRSKTTVASHASTSARSRSPGAAGGAASMWIPCGMALSGWA